MTVTLFFFFVEQPIIDSLNTCEDKWLSKLNAQTNIESVILPLCEIVLVPISLSTSDVH